MEHPKEQAHHVQEALNNWVGSEITIYKEEDGDIDRTAVLLQDTEIERINPIDDYILPFSLRLKGPGIVIADEEQSRLPYQTYEIPFEHIMERHVQENEISFKTNRAVYTITKQ
ncbi:hypothetical protein PP175_14920 [Aneurinibacillus sp. Ricciae_BoGa-3]|uniref:hypothetical protein n=1 Tax=Aneurinibacillus sp. Ricciae_BoGa-3 TaxID=3022697 RepID=UPI00233F88FA|nr:hypothetical protein [Aneurinibacillus sp. Ricciae_BoGa-3]WCK52720.1 hypothetical protein PP175_14920 [Aneurinibacillus sp. Ricciae_BoGa-3]